MPTLYLIRGVSGAGKSTFAQTLDTQGVVSVVIEADQYFTDEYGNYNFDPTKLRHAHEQCQYSCRDYLERGYSVAVSNTSTTEKEVATYKEIAELTGARFVSIIVENRHQGTNLHNVPEDKIQQMKNRFSVKL